MPIHLDITAGPLQGTTFAFDWPDVLIVGRAEDAHCRLADDSHVSRHHMLFEVDPPMVTVRDTGSLNGFLVNGVQYGGRDKSLDKDHRMRLSEATLQAGNTIQVGETVFRVRVEPDAPAFAGSVPVPRAAGDDEKRVKTSRGTTVLLDAPRIPGWDLVKMLGQGNMGKIYLGRNQADDTHAAVKVLRPRKLRGEDSRKKLEREIEMCQCLRHPHIIEYLGHGFLEKHVYLILEYMEQGGLDHVLEERGGALPLAEAVPIMRGAAAGMAFAHGHGYVHRDLKPGNILLAQRDGKTVAKISDLGLAKSFQNAGLSGMTSTGDIGGTYAYMPREQLVNYKYVAPVSDVFALGATFYIMLTGDMVYDLSNFTSPLSMVLEGRVVPIRERDPSIPPALAQVIDAAVTPDHKKRYQTAGEFDTALEAALREVTPA